MTTPNPRSSFNPMYASSFQGIDDTNLYVLSQDGNLWLEHGEAGYRGLFASVPPPRELVDQNVRGFQAIDANNVFVLGTDGNLWLEHSVNGKFGANPPPREQVDGSVAAFQAVNATQVYVLAEDGNLWLEHGDNGIFGQVPPPREQVDGDVIAFAALPGDWFTCFVLGADHSLWIEHSVNGIFGQVPPPRELIDRDVAAFQPLSYDDVFVLGTDQNLWFEHSVNDKFGGQVPPPREQVDGDVMTFQAFGPTVIFVLGSDGNLWYESPVNGKFGTVPPPRVACGEDVADFQIVTPPPPEEVPNMLGYNLLTNGAIAVSLTPFDYNVRLPTAYGFVRPKYLILTLVYAPPGTAGAASSAQVQSQVQYGTGSTTGATTSLSNQFKSGFDLKAEVGTMVDTASVDFNASKSTTDSSQLQISKGELNTITVHGPTVDGIDHDYDLFYLLLSPDVALTADPQSAGTWEIATQPQDMKTVYVQVGQIKNPPTLPMSPSLADTLKAAGLTQDDYDQILNLDPFSSGSTQIDGRRYVAQITIPYEYTQGENQSQNFSLTSSKTSTSTQTVENQYGVTASASAGVQGIFKVTATFTFEWTNTNSTSQSEQTSQSAAAVIGSPSANWTGSPDVVVYLDTVYNSFMFAFEL